MSANGYLQLAFYVVVLIALAKPLGALHGARSMKARPSLLSRIGGPVRTRSSIVRAASMRRRKRTGSVTPSRC